jgi:hypothetical protein
MNNNQGIKKFLTADVTSTKKKEEDHLSVPSSPFMNIKRDLKEEDLKNPAVQRLILSENDKLEHHVHSLELIRDQYHIIDKQCAVLSSKIDQNSAFEIIYTICVAIGSALSGISAIYWEQKGYILLLIGLGLTFGGIVAKIFRK